MTFWDNFTRACVLNGVSPTAICKKIGLSNATATHWRQGALPKADAIAAVADLLGVSADYLLGRSDLQEKSARRYLRLNAACYLLFVLCLPIYKTSL